MKFDFLPMWYIDRMNKAQKKVDNVIISLLFLINVFLVFLIYSVSKEYADITFLKNEVQGEINRLDNLKYNVKAVDKESEEAVRSYDKLKTLLYDGKLSSVEIINGEMKLKTEHANFESYLEFIKGLEKSKTFSITNMQPPINHGGYINNYITVKSLE